MIIPMKKLSLVVMKKDQEECLKKIREVGVLHIQEKNVSNAILTDLFRKKANVEKALLILESFKAEAKLHSMEIIGKKTDPLDSSGDLINPKGIPFSVDALDISATKYPDIANHVLDLDEQRNSLIERKATLTSEHERLKDWGYFSFRDLQHLARNGVTLYFYEYAPGILKYLPEDVPFIVVHKSKKTAHILTINSKIANNEPLSLGQYSLADMESILEDINDQLHEQELQLTAFYYQRHILEEELESIGEKIEFETVNAGMESYLIANTATGISWITGFAPNDSVEGIEKAALDNSWVLSVTEPTALDTPPTILKTKSIARVIQPLFKILGTIPGYWEYDVSSLYMFFFCIFFAMIFGDAGYGLVFLAISLIMGIATKIKYGKFNDVSILLLFLSVFTIIWGSITGAWFSFPHSSLPPILQSLIIPPFNNTGPLAEFPVFLQNIFNLPPTVPVDALKTRWNIQFLCFSIALIQLVSARIYLMRKLMPSLSAIAQIGWILMLIGMYFLVLSLLLKIILPSFAIHFIIVGISISFIFTEQKGGNFFVNIAKSFTNFFTFFLNLVGCFGDIISYIRLFAVGLAGSLIAQTVNSLAIPAEGLGYGEAAMNFIISLIAASLVFGFGHLLNVLMGGLSLVVHGIRLNLLEFAGNHLGMEWSGYEYNPFAFRKKI